MKIGPAARKEWWGWEPYMDTWEMLDEYPDAPVRSLPLWKVMRRHFNGRTYTDERVDEYMEERRILYRSLKVDGYDPTIGKRMKVVIDDGGVLSLRNGHSRVSMLRHLGYGGEVEAWVSKRSDGWLGFKQKVYDVYKGRPLYQPIEHPDFADWRVWRSCADRLEGILSFTGSVEGKSVLDVGCQTGWFSHELASRGAEVIGIDRRRKWTWIADYLSPVYGLPEGNPEFVVAKFLQYLEDDVHFDYILYLSVLQHELRRDVDRAWRGLDLISRRCSVAFIELATRRLPVEWSPELVFEHSEFTGVKSLKGDDDYAGGRPLYAYFKED